MSKRIYKVHNNGERVKKNYGSSVIYAGKKKKYHKKRKFSQWQFLLKKTKEFRKHPTAAEAIFGRKLQELGIKYTFQYPFLCGGIGGISDFWLFEHNLLIEIDGGYHLDDGQQGVDEVKDFICQSKLHKKVLRLTNNQAIYLSIEQILILINDKIRKH